MPRPRDSRSTLDSSPEQIGCLAALVRIGWLVGGCAALAMLALMIARAGTFGRWDPIFWGVVVLMAVIRLIDITRFGGLTADGGPATIRTWRRYVLRLVLVAGGFWALAHTVLPHMVP